MRNRPARVLFLVLFSLLLAIGIAEVCSRLLLPETYLLDWHSDEFNKAKLLVEIQNRKKKDSSVQDNRIKNTVYDANLGWRMKPSFRFEGVIHNSKGFRGSQEYNEQPEGIRIFTIGDSYTYGLGVYDEYTFASHLDEMAGVEVINAGVNGYGIDQAYLMWELEGKKLNPSVVLLGYFVDDFYRNALSVSGKPKPHFIKDEDSGEFKINWVPVPTVESLVKEGELESDGSLRIVQALKWVKRSIIEKYHLQDNVGYDDYKGLVERAQLSEYILTQLNESVEESGASLIVVIIGIVDTCYQGQPEYLWIENSIVEACRANGIEYINLAELMRQERYFPSFYARHCHFTESGHRFAAEKIADVLGLKQ